jgi:3-hydroxybutyryl-CoA dehydrogenase
VIGAGTMGNGIAQVFATSGRQVTLVDVSAPALDRGLASIEKSLGKLVEKERLSAAERDEALGRIGRAASLEAAQGASIVVEAVVASLDVKRKVFAEAAKAVSASAVLASNTSSISITELARTVPHPERVIGMHFMNPVPLMKLVEIIRGLQTSDATHATTMALSQQLGKIPHTANDAAGFVANRILMPMTNESIFALAENVGTREAIDEIMKLGCAFPMGPLTLADFIGLDVCLAIMEVLHNELGDSKYRPAPLLRQMVDAGWLGRKSGRGFYDYSADSSK